jgi:hypothetical protein
MKVSTEDAVNGTTTEDILNEDGGLVLPEGVCLSQALVNALLNQNINKVSVSFDDATEALAHTDQISKPEAPQIDSEFKSYVDQLFIRHRGPFMKEFQQCLLQIKK